MFATMRRKRRSAKLKSELGQSVDHFKRAATIAAQETSATVGPRLNAARDRVQPAVSQARDAASSGWGSAVATITPLVAAAGEKGKETAKLSRRGRKKARKLEKKASKAVSRKRSGGGRKGRLLGLALAGAAVGAGAAFVLRRRQQAQWDEYDPAPPIEPEGADDAAFEPSPMDSPTVSRTES